MSFSSALQKHLHTTITEWKQTRLTYPAADLTIDGKLQFSWQNAAQAENDHSKSCQVMDNTSAVTVPD